MKTIPTKGETAEGLLEDGPRILNRLLERSPLFRNSPLREVPPFAPKELKKGHALGAGSFSEVHEVQRISAYRPIINNHHDQTTNGPRHSSTSTSTAATATSATTISSTDPKSTHHHHQHTTSGSDKLSASATVVVGCNINEARQQMSGAYIRNGNTRYAIKSLKRHGLTDLERARGRIDLAIEIQYLRSLHHPNIIKIRGVFLQEQEQQQDDDDDDDEGRRRQHHHHDKNLHPDNFFLMDRLYDTLDKRIHEWNQNLNNNKKGRIFGVIPRLRLRREILEELLIKQLTVAFDVASAVAYLHKHRVIHRDIAAENIGFDIRENAKLFDFGLATSMMKHHQDDNHRSTKIGFYNLTARTGSFPYMAPEVATYELYNETCDVYSFAILLWEILALRPALGEEDGIRNKKDFYDKVCVGGLRPKISPRWPTPECRSFMERAFLRDPLQRPGMEEAANGALRADLENACQACGVTNRHKFLEDQSNRSLRRKKDQRRRRQRGRASFALSTRTIDGRRQKSGLRESIH